MIIFQQHDVSAPSAVVGSVSLSFSLSLSGGRASVVFVRKNIVGRVLFRVWLLSHPLVFLVCLYIVCVFFSVFGFSSTIVVCTLETTNH